MKSLIFIVLFNSVVKSHLAQSSQMVLLPSALCNLTILLIHHCDLRDMALVKCQIDMTGCAPALKLVRFSLGPNETQDVAQFGHLLCVRTSMTSLWEIWFYDHCVQRCFAGG